MSIQRRIGSTRAPSRIPAALWVVACLVATASPAGGQIAWRSGDRSAPTPVSAAQAVETLETLVAGGARHVIVQLAGPVGPELRERLAEGGVGLQAYLGESAFFASVSPDGLDAVQLAAIAELRGTALIERARKLHPDLIQRRYPVWSVVGEAATPEPEPVVALYGLFHADVALDAAVDVVEQRGGVVRSRLRSVNGLVLELPASAIDGLADHDAVSWLEPPLPPLSEMNDSNRTITGANVVQSAPFGLDGSGVTVMVYDSASGLESHSDFGGRLTSRDGTGVSDHSTHVAGTIGGDGSGSGGQFRGMAPGVTIESYGFEQAGGLQEGFLYTDPGDMEQDYSSAISLHGAVIANNSIGTNTATNGFPCEWTGDYGVTSTIIDTIARGDSSNPLFTDPFRIIWANGNERQSSRCGDQYATTAPPATAKNHITVGALNSNDDSMTSFSSWGPTDDGRLKPDVSAPGCQADDDGGVTSTSSGGGYSVKCGTSMASPTVCGLSALLIQDFRAQFSGQPDFRASTLKALLAHTAEDLGNVGPDYQFGYGSVRIEQAIDTLRSGAFQEASVDQGQTWSTQITLPALTPELRVTLAWDDVPGTPNVDPALVNDLDLVVTGPGGQAFPWTLDPASPGDPAVQTQADHLNNIEQVLVVMPQAGTWTIEVVGFDVPSGPQPFSLVGDGAQNVGAFIALGSVLPGLIAPGDATDVTVEITAIGETIVPGSELLNYRYDGGTFLTAALTPLGGGSYQATLPGPACDDQPEFYFSAEGSVSGPITSPPGAPGATYSASVGVEETLLALDFEVDPGWTVSGDALDGPWERAVPLPHSTCDRGNPDSDSDGSGQCWVTDNSSADACNSDVDDGTTILTSDAMDLTGGATINYAYWLDDSPNPMGSEDFFEVEIATDAAGTNWQLVRDHSPASIWRTDAIDVDEATATATVRIRFRVADLSPGDVVEAGIDDFSVTRIGCDDGGLPCPGDVGDGNGMVDVVDLLALLAAWGSSDPAFDIAPPGGDGSVDILDLLELLDGWGPCP